MEVPLHTLMKLTPKAYGVEVEKIKANIPAVSTWRPQGSTAQHHEPGEATEVVGDVGVGKHPVKEHTKTVSTGGELKI